MLYKQDCFGLQQICFIRLAERHKVSMEFPIKEILTEFLYEGIFINYKLGSPNISSILISFLFLMKYRFIRKMKSGEQLWKNIYLRIYSESTGLSHCSFYTIFERKWLQKKSLTWYHCCSSSVLEQGILRTDVWVLLFFLHTLPLSFPKPTPEFSS